MKKLLLRAAIRIIRSIYRLGTRALRHRAIPLSDWWPEIEKWIDTVPNFYTVFDLVHRNVWFFLQHKQTESGPLYLIDTALSFESRALLEQLRSFLTSHDYHCDIKINANVKRARHHLVIDANNGLSARQLVDTILFSFLECSPNETVDLYIPREIFFHGISESRAQVRPDN